MNEYVVVVVMTVTVRAKNDGTARYVALRAIETGNCDDYEIETPLFTMPAKDAGK